MLEFCHRYRSRYHTKIINTNFLMAFFMKKYYLLLVFAIFFSLERVSATENILEKQLQLHFDTQIQQTRNTQTGSIAPQIYQTTAPISTSIQTRTTPIQNQNITIKTNTGFSMTFSDIPHITTLDDSSIYRFVWPEDSLNNIYYEPDDLVSISSEYISSNERIRREAKEKLEALAENFYKNFHKKLTVISGYRSYEEQRSIAQNSPSCIKNKFCALPWHSEHQLGLAVDIEWLTKELFEQWTYKNYISWMQEHAHTYWWTQSYRKWIEIDWYNREPWHWRYIWAEIAKELKNSNTTLTQYTKKSLK